MRVKIIGDSDLSGIITLAPHGSLRQPCDRDDNRDAEWGLLFLKNEYNWNYIANKEWNAFYHFEIIDSDKFLNFQIAYGGFIREIYES